jgi:hypothetical protein
VVKDFLMSFFRPDIIRRAIIHFLIVILAILLLGWSLAPFIEAQELPQWAYTLEDQNEPEYLALRTQYGTLRVLPDKAAWGCGYLKANSNVLIAWDRPLVLQVQTEDGAWQISCPVDVVGRVDEEPCSMNDWGDCDVVVENAF